MASIRSLSSFTIDAPPSCVAFCPTKPDQLVIGTYTLHQAGQQEHKSSTDRSSEEPRADQPVGEHEAAPSSGQQHRTGSLLLFKLVDEQLVQIAELPTSAAVLDVAWSPCAQEVQTALDGAWTPHAEDGQILAVACSDGRVELYRPSKEARLERIATLRVSESSNLVLDLLWHPTAKNIMGVTLSQGEIVLCELDSSLQKFTSLRTIAHHELEPWTLAFLTNPSCVFSGGDDRLLQCISTSSSSNNDSEPAAILWKDSKIHSAGITAILPLNDTLIVTGSYDDHIRLVQRLPSRRPTVLAESDLGGGVWRLSLLSETKMQGEMTSLTMLASCMHAGTRIVRLKHDASPEQANVDDSWSFEILAAFTEHQSMNYGSDVQPAARDKRLRTIVSTSFYDKLVCVWQYTED